MNLLLTAARSVIGLAYPMQCGACKKPLPAQADIEACARCLAAIKPNPRPYCRTCGHGVSHDGGLCAGCRAAKPSFTIARSACLYEGALKELIHLYKYRNRRSLATTFSDLIIDFLRSDDGPSNGSELVTFVPLHRRRAAERGFNQSELLARSIAPRLGLPAVACLDKTKDTRRQNELPRSERLGNLKYAFRARGSAARLFGGLSVLLVDDVMTTGATLDECSRVLMEAGAREVRCITLARGI